MISRRDLYGATIAVAIGDKAPVMGSAVSLRPSLSLKRRGMQRC